MLVIMFFVFIGLAIYGFVIGKLGGAIIALLISLALPFAARQLRKRDIEHYLSPSSATKESTALDELKRQDTVAGGPRL